MIGRKREQQKLKSAFQSRRAEFVGVYGRRRVGKTYLISESFARNFVFQHAGLSPVEEEQKE
ncbi:MAG: ATP-binding protein, partial [Bacilli bacterium]|nr:ATP-binding protein [Bacilli bacterium]